MNDLANTVLEFEIANEKRDYVVGKSLFKPLIHVLLFLKRREVGIGKRFVDVFC